MIVVEGFDMSGKSTLANRIQESLGWPVLHTGGPTRDEADVLACLLRSKRRAQKRCIQDRITHISESVYSMTEFPRKAALALDAIRTIPIGTMVIYCRPPTDFLISELRTRHTAKAHDTQDILSRIQRDALQMIQFYDTVMAMVSHRVEVIHYNRCLPGDMARIISMVEERFT